MTQSQINQKWISNLGGISILDTPKLKKGRYQYQISFADSVKLKNDLKNFFETLNQDPRSVHGDAYLEIKPTKKGFRLGCFILFHSVGFMGGSSGYSQAEWDKVNVDLNAILSQFLNPVYVFHENWSSTCKFQNRFETYIEVI